MTNSKISIRKMTKSDIKRVVEIHLQVFEGFFLSFLGPRFLTILYSAIVDDLTGISFLAFDEQNTYGFVAGTTEAAGFYRRLIMRRLLKFSVASLQPALRNPRILPRLIRALSMPTKVALPERCGLLMSIGVSTEVQSEGVGRLLVDTFLEEAMQRGLKKVYLTTDKNNNGKVNSFYQKIGFRYDNSYITPEGRWMNEYVIDLPVSKAIS